MPFALRRIAAALVITVALGVFAFVLTRAVFYNPETEIAAPANVAMVVLPEDMPARLRIPALGIDAAVQKLGLTTGKRMAAPSNFSDVGWYKYGPAPGMAGSAVIAGHLDNGLGLSGVFKNLHKVAVGDVIEVATAGGATRRFAVTRLEEYPYTDVPKEVFTQNDAARLNLVTSSGKRIKVPNLGWTIDHRLVVYAVAQA